MMPENTHPGPVAGRQWWGGIGRACAAGCCRQGEEGAKTDVSRPQTWRQCYCQRLRLLEGSRFVRGPCGGHSRLRVLLAERLKEIPESLFRFPSNPCSFPFCPGPFPRVTHSRATSCKSGSSPQAPASRASLELQLHLCHSCLAGTRRHTHLGRVVDIGFLSSSSPREFCVFWFCHPKKDITELDKFQRRAAKLIKGIAKLPSEGTLKRL